MATIKTDRDAAKAFNGQKCKFVRPVGPADPSFNEAHGERQVIVEIDGQERQFFADEVTLDESETAKAEAARKSEKSKPAPAAPQPLPDNPQNRTPTTPPVQPVRQTQGE